MADTLLNVRPLHTLLVKYIALLLLIVGTVACHITVAQKRQHITSQAVLDDSTLDLYEAAFRHQFTYFHHPRNTPAYVLIEGRPPPDALLRRLTTTQRPVLAWHDGYPSGVRTYSLQLGTTTSTYAYVMASYSRYDYMRGYRAERRDGRWVIVHDEIVTIS